MKLFLLTLLVSLAFPQAAFSKNWSAKLFTAVKECDVEKIEKAIKKGADVEAMNGIYNGQTNRYTPIVLAARTNCIEGVRILLDHKANPNFGRAIDTNRPLMIAARWNYIEIAKILLDPKYKTDVNAA